MSYMTLPAWWHNASGVPIRTAAGEGQWVRMPSRELLPDIGRTRCHPRRAPARRPGLFLGLVVKPEGR